MITKKIKFILNNYLSINDGSTKYLTETDKTKIPLKNQVIRTVLKELPEILYRFIDKDKYYIKGSVGQAGMTIVPWLAIFSRNISISAQKGIDIVFLFKADMSGFYLSLNQGSTYLTEHYKNDLFEISTFLRKKAYEFTALENIKFVEKINLQVPKYHKNGKGYEKTHILGFEYFTHNLPDELKLQKDITALIYILNQLEQSLQIDQNNLENFYSEVINNKQNIQALQLEPEIYDEDEFQHLLNSTENLDTLDVTNQKKISQSRVTQTRVWTRDLLLAKKSVELAKFKCEVSSEHVTFINKLGLPYLEAHHLIPLSLQRSETFLSSPLDSIENLVALCPNCHRAIHYGDMDSKLKVIRQLLKGQRIEALKSIGIKVDIEQLQKIYDE